VFQVKSNHKSIFILFGLLILATATALAALPLRNQKSSTVIGPQKNDDSQMPVADFGLADPADPKERALRQARGNRYSKGGAQPIAELMSGEEVLPLNSHWWWGLPALPANQSDAIVTGEIVGAKAYISNDKTEVYSEFEVRVSEVLRNERSLPLAFGSEVAIDRLGGVVRFPSGRLQRYRIAHQAMPVSGRRYLFFLEFNESGQSFSLLTAYEFKDGRVLPLDGYGERGEPTVTSFTAFEGMDETTFLKAVSEAMTNRSPNPSERATKNQ
jgi:hypothetical protein